MKRAERKEVKKILRKQLELLAKQSEKSCNDDITNLSHVMIEIAEAYKNF